MASRYFFTLTEREFRSFAKFWIPLNVKQIVGRMNIFARQRSSAMNSKSVSGSTTKGNKDPKNVRSII